MKADKTHEKMRNNPRDWTISDLEVLAKRFNINIRRGGGSHVTFSHKNWVEILTVPAHRPIKPVYIKKFIHLIDLLQLEEGNNE